MHYIGENIPWTTVFISYSHADKSVAEELAEGLQKAGCIVWIDEGALRAGDSIITCISAAVDQSRFIVALISQNSVESVWCNKELSIAIHNSLSSENLSVLPLRIGNVRMPASLRDVKYLKVNPASPCDILPKLLADMRSHLIGDAFVNMLSETTTYSETDLRHLRLALRSHKDDVPLFAANALVQDRSVPATETLFEEATREALKNLHLGYAGAGLSELGPASAPWLLKMLSHEDARVVRTAFDGLFAINIDNPVIGYFKTQAIIDAIVEKGSWNICENKLKKAISQDDDDYFFLETLLECASNIVELGK